MVHFVVLWVVCEECMNITYRISVPIGYRCYPVNQPVVSFRNLGHIVEDRCECSLLCIKHLKRTRHIHIIALRNQVNLVVDFMNLGRIKNYLEGFLQSHGLGIDNKDFLIEIVESLVGIGYIELAILFHDTFQIVATLESAFQGHVLNVDLAHLSTILGDIDVVAFHIHATGFAFVFRERVSGLFLGEFVQSGYIFGGVE